MIKFAIKLIWVSLLLLLKPSYSWANVTGAVKFSYLVPKASSVNSTYQVTHRLMYEQNVSSAWSLNVASELAWTNQTETKLNAGLPVAQSWWNLSNQGHWPNNQVISHNFDRLQLNYSDQHLVLKFGRQALTWGHGLVFKAFDLVSPFSPTATDTEYKTGTDMFYGQWLFANGDDVQWLYAPRRWQTTGKLAKDASVYGVKYQHGIYGRYLSSIELLLANDYQQTIQGIAASGQWLQASWQFEWLNRAGQKQALVNMQYAHNIGEFQALLFAELYYQSFGLSAKTITPELPENLQLALARGQSFVTAKQSLALGSTITFTPLSSLQLVWINNLNDHSQLWQLKYQYDWFDNLTVIAGMHQSIGANNTEFGSQQLNQTAHDQWYIRMHYYY